MAPWTRRYLFTLVNTDWYTRWTMQLRIHCFWPCYSLLVKVMILRLLLLLLNMNNKAEIWNTVFKFTFMTFARELYILIVTVFGNLRQLFYLIYLFFSWKSLVSNNLIIFPRFFSENASLASYVSFLVNVAVSLHFYENTTIFARRKHCFTNRSN